MGATDGTFRAFLMRAANWPESIARLLRGHSLRSAESTLAEMPSEKILQQLTRIRTADGEDAIRGTLTAEFSPGERQITLYIGFCPPFETLPQVEANVADDSDADVKLAQLLHNGAQLDIRLSEPAEDVATVTVEFFAVEPE